MPYQPDELFAQEPGNVPDVFVAELADLVQTMVNESGDAANFDAKLWATEWLSSPVPAIGWRRPLELMAMQAGRDLLKNLLKRSQSGAYS